MKIIFDIGGTNMRVAGVNDNKIDHIETVGTPPNPGDGVKQLIELSRKIAGTEDIESITGGVAGTFDSSGAIFNSPHLMAWKGLNLATALGKEFSARVGVGNDASLAALGEAVFGAGRGAKIVAYVGIGTGVGGAKIVDGKIDANASGFEPGQMILANGKSFESQVAGGGLMSELGKSGPDLPASVYEERTPFLAMGIYNMIMLWSPEVLVIGGSMLNDADGYRLERVREEITKLPNVFFRIPEIRAGELKNANGLWGAVVLSREPVLKKS